MATATVTINERELEVEYDYVPGEKQTWNNPGCLEAVTLEAATDEDNDAVDLTDEEVAEAERQILEQLADAHDVRMAGYDEYCDSVRDRNDMY